MFPFGGLGNMDPKKMQKMMGKLGIKTEEIEADEVIIKGKKNIVIKNPQVVSIDMQGQKSFQISGDVSEGEVEAFSDEDVKLVAEQAGVSEEEARKALEESNGDIAKAILDLKK